ncbi:MAG: diguanylate cyclase domain-containing protein [Solirubrobacterales bacterium]
MPKPRQKISERELMLNSGAFLWMATGLGTFIVGVVAPQLAPEHLHVWQVTLCLTGAIAVWSMLTWMKKLDDVRVYQAMALLCTLSVAIDGALMMANPLSIGALYISALAHAVFSSYFLPKRMAIVQVVWGTFAMLLPVVVHYDEIETAHVAARVAAFLPIMWSVSYAVFTHKRNRAKAMEHNERFAYTDPLTGVANLRALEARAAEVLSDRNARISGETALLLIDLDDFKGANTLHGHAGGDQVLRSIGQALRRAASKSHLVARIGGDEFAVLIENADPRDVRDLAIRYRNAVISARGEIKLEGVSVDASIGSAITTTDGPTLEDLMTAADRSMYEVKDRHTLKSEARRAEELNSRLPIEFQTRGEGHWQGEHPPEPELRRTDELRWRNRPAYAKFAALTWALGVTVGLISLAMPDADHSHLAVALTGLLCGYGVSVVAYMTAPEIGSWRHLMNDIFTLVSIALIAYLTGGSDSPLWPLVFLFIIYEAWFLDSRKVWFRLIGPVAVILMPLLYESPSEIGAPAGAALYSGVLVAVGLTMVMSYNMLHMERAEEEAERLAKTDARTGLANRREFEKRVQAELDQLGYNDTDALAIVMLDLDNFKNVNTTHGHKAGDELLEDIADALAGCARADDCVARVGGDEFAIVVTDVNAETARTLARRYINAVAACTSRSPLPACNAVTASAGFALYGLHGRTLDALINAADVALMSVKTSGKGVERVSSYVVSL